MSHIGTALDHDAVFTVVDMPTLSARDAIRDIIQRLISMARDVDDAVWMLNQHGFAVAGDKVVWKPYPNYRSFTVRVKPGTWAAEQVAANY